MAMAATFFGEVVKAPCRAGTEEEEEEEEQSRRDTPEDREVRRQLARKRSGSGQAHSAGREGERHPGHRLPPSTPRLRSRRVSAGSSVFKHTDARSPTQLQSRLSRCLPEACCFYYYTSILCVCLGPEVEVGCPVALSTFFLGRVSLNAELTVILHWLDPKP